MVMDLRAKAASTGASVVIPIDTVPGDLLVLRAGIYSQTISTSLLTPPDGTWTQVLYGNGTGGNNTHMAVWQRKATITDPGSTVTVGSSGGNYGITEVLVLTEPEAEPVHCSALQKSTALGTTMSTGPMEATRKVRRLLFFSHMDSTGGAPASFPTPGGFTVLHYQSGASGSFMRHGSYLGPATEEAGFIQNVSLTASENGTWVAMQIGLGAGGAAPPPSQVVIPTEGQLWPRGNW